MNWRRALVEDIITKMLPVIMSDINSDKLRTICVDVSFEDLPGEIKGLCGVEDDAEYIIIMGRNQTREELITNMVHELTHVMQVERGDKFNYDLPYTEQLHEIEAYNKQDIYADVYNNLK